MLKNINVSACGICCSVCHFFQTEKCSCSSGIEEKEVKRKFAAQKKVLGQVCPILECAYQKKIAYCSRDCDNFPCSKYQDKWGCFPYSQGFLKMVERRKNNKNNIKQ